MFLTLPQARCLSQAGEVKNALLVWCEAHIDRTYQTWDNLAAAAGMPKQGGVLKRYATERGTLAVDTLLRLSVETGESPDALLRLAGKAADADLIARAYRVPSDLSPALRLVLDAAAGVQPEYLLEVVRFCALLGKVPPAVQSTDRSLPEAPAATTKSPRGGKAAAR